MDVLIALECCQLMRARFRDRGGTAGVGEYQMKERQEGGERERERGQGMKERGRRTKTITLCEVGKYVPKNE